jgi:hypothetical protein
MTNNIKKDIEKWTLDFVEETHPVTGYPICPYAKKARMDNQTKIEVHTKGRLIEFLENLVDKNYPSDTITIVAAKPRYLYHPTLDKQILELNKRIIPKNLFIQGGIAKHTKSKFKTLIQGSYYFCVINKLYPVLKGADALTKTNYYATWSDEHFKRVVDNRNKLVYNVLQENNLSLEDIKDI